MTDDDRKQLDQLRDTLDRADQSLDELVESLRTAENAAEALGWIPPQEFQTLREWLARCLEEGVANGCDSCQRALMRINVFCVLMDAVGGPR